MKKIHERLKEFRTKNGYTMKALCEKAGMPLRTYQNYEAGIREPGLSAIVALADAYNVSTDYLLGRAPQADAMALLIAQTDVSPEALVRQFAALPDDGKALMMAMIRALKETRRIRQIQQKPNPCQIKLHLNRASAGFGYDLSSADEWEEIEIADTPQANAADFAVEVSGDSMEPDYRDGDIVLIRRDPDVPVGKVGLFVHDGMGYIKERGRKKLISRNPGYPDIEGEARCIGLVIGIAEQV